MNNLVATNTWDQPKQFHTHVLWGASGGRKAQIDFILITGDVDLQSLHCVPSNSVRVGGSDHFPLALHVRWKSTSEELISFPALRHKSLKGWRPNKISFEEFCKRIMSTMDRCTTLVRRVQHGGSMNLVCSLFAQAMMSSI